MLKMAKGGKKTNSAIQEGKKHLDTREKFYIKSARGTLALDGEGVGGRS